MTPTSEEVLDFAKGLMLGCAEPRGASWTQVELDGFFFNRFVNLKLHSAIWLARRNITINSEVGLQDADENPLTSSDGTRAHDLATPWAVDIGEKFCVRWDYVKCAIIHDGPIAFGRLQFYPGYQKPTSFGVLIYALPFNDEARIEMREEYEHFVNMSSGNPSSGTNRQRRSGVSVGANIRSKMLKKPQCLVVRSDPPYASSKVFVQVVEDALKAYKSELIGGVSTQSTIREWTVYLLAQCCGYSNRNAIQQWNSTIGNLFGYSYSYRMAENSVTSPGEVQFSRDKLNLEKRIAHYYRHLIPP